MGEMDTGSLGFIANPPQKNHQKTYTKTVFTFLSLVFGQGGYLVLF